MANYATLKAAINAVIKANGNKEITGTVLNETLTAMVNSLGADYQFAGVATPSTNPGTPDQNVFYLAGQGGYYTNFNNIVIPDGVSVLMYNGTWNSMTIFAGDGGCFDISTYMESGGILATFADLSAALNGGSNIPQELRKGGLSVKFIRSTDNQYVQYRLLSNSWSIDVNNWAFSQRLFLSENPEWLYSIVDGEKKVLHGIHTDGTLHIKTNLTIDGSIQLKGITKEKGFESIEYLKLETDYFGKILSAIYKDGSHYIYNLRSESIDILTKTVGILVDKYEYLNTTESSVPAIRKAVEEAGEGGTIVFTPNKTYLIDDMIWMKKNQVILGNGATLKRANESKTTTVGATTVNSSYCTVTFESIPQDWKEALEFSTMKHSAHNVCVFFFSEEGGQSGTYLTAGYIKSINGNSVTFSMLKTGMTIPSGCIALRSYAILFSSQTSPAPYKIFNLTFDGNKANNDSLHNWEANGTVYNYGYGSLIDSCKFINIPSENIIGQGIVVRNCYAKNLNSCFIHLSYPPDNLLDYGYESYMGTFVIGNFCENIMIYDESIMGHNLAPVTYSFNPGKLVVIGNQFYGNNTSKCILMDAITPSDEVGSTTGEDMRYAIYIGNMYVNFPKIGDIPLISNNQTSIHSRLITNNIFRNCGTSDMQRLYRTELCFENNAYYGNTVVNTGGNSKMYRIDTEITTTPSASELTAKYTNLPVGGEVYILQLNKLYKKMLTNNSSIIWNEENINVLQ